jgi:predicted DNA-binding transcriptional regulator AlpA
MAVNDIFCIFLLFTISERYIILAQEKNMEDKLLDQGQLCKYLEVSKFTVWKLQKEKDFPKPVMILSKKKWRKSEIDAYLEKTRET